MSALSIDTRITHFHSNFFSLLESSLFSLPTICLRLSVCFNVWTISFNALQAPGMLYCCHSTVNYAYVTVTPMLVWTMKSKFSSLTRWSCSFSFDYRAIFRSLEWVLSSEIEVGILCNKEIELINSEFILVLMGVLRWSELLFDSFDWWHRV